MLVIKKYSYTFTGHEQDFFLRLFVDTEKNRDVLSNGSLWDDGDTPERHWRGKVNMNSRTFAIRRLISNGRSKRKISDIMIKGRLKEGTETRLEIEFSLNLFAFLFQLGFSVMVAIAAYGSMKDPLAFVAGFCVFALLLLLNMLDFNKSFNKLHDYLPSNNSASRKDNKATQQKRYLK